MRPDSATLQALVPKTPIKSHGFKINLVVDIMVTKKIWTYWHQGWEQAPSLVRQCQRSWTRLNPDYEMHALDQNSLFDHIEFPKGFGLQRKDLTIQKVSALARLALLSKYGGVWTDATVMCTRPLSEWLEEYDGSQFFALRAPWKDRLISNWFIAAQSESVILRRLTKSFSDFFADNHFSNQDTALGNMLQNHFRRRWNSNISATLNWHSWFARNVLRIYPYFIFHYTFNKLILEDPECAKLWNETKTFSAEPSHRVQYLESASNGVEKAKREIDSGIIPMHKLNWRVDTSNSYWTSILPYFHDCHHSFQQNH